MFSVIFEVRPKPHLRDAYLGTAKALRPELEQIDGFVDNVRYKSLRREGWVLSLSGWRNEKSLVRWRTQMRHHMAQEAGRGRIFMDYQLRVGQVTKDTRLPEGYTIIDQGLDETEVGRGTTVTLIDGAHPVLATNSVGPAEIVRALGLQPHEEGLISWDVCDAVLTPGDLILVLSWRNQEDAIAFEDRLVLPPRARLRRVRIVRDYSMFDRREAPQYFPEAAQARPRE